MKHFNNKVFIKDIQISNKNINFTNLDLMQDQTFPNIQKSKDFKPTSQQHVTQIIEYIKYIHEKHNQLNYKNKTQGKKVEIDQKAFKQLQTLTKQLSKIIAKFPEHLFLLLKELIYFFNDIGGHPIFVTLLMNILGPDMKFQAVSRQTQQQQKINNQSGFLVIALPMIEESVIALPDSSPCTTVAVHASSDVGNQQNRQANEKYFIEDDKRVVEYLQNPFKTVKRQGISELFQKVTDFLLKQFIEMIIYDTKTIYNLHIDTLISIIRLIEYLSAPLYTYYFLSLIKSITSLIVQCFTAQPSSKIYASILSQDLIYKIKRTEYEQLIYSVRSLTQRWNDHKSDFSIELWQWQMEKQMIITFLQSTTSQKQLYAVKVLIDRCRKVTYNSYSVLNLQEFMKFIKEFNLLQKIYRAENHPQIIIKGKELYEFMSKHDSLDHTKIQLIFDLILKSNENICKSLYSTLQSTGHVNLENNREYIMKKISSLPRSNLFYNETFTLIQALILLTPVQIISESLKYVCEIISEHYFGLKPQLKQKLLNIYFEVYLMGVEEGQFDLDQHKVMVALEPFLKDSKTKDSSLTFLIIDKFFQKLKQQLPKKIGSKCKRIMNICIQKLFKLYKIHHKQLKITEQSNVLVQDSRQLRINQLELIKQLFELMSDKQLAKDFLSEEQLWELIEQDSYFGRFLSYYSTSSQLYLLQKLISKTPLTQKDIQNIIESFYFMDKDVKDQIFVKIYQIFYSTKQILLKQKLVQFVCKVEGLSAENISQKIIYQTKQLENIQNKIDNLEHLLAALMQLKEYLSFHDKKGCGSYPAFKYLTCDYSVKLKVLNMIDVFNPLTFDLEEKNYKTLYDVIKHILPLVNKSLKEIKLKIDKNERYVTLEQLKEKLNELSPYREISITIEESNDCQWYDQSLLMNKNKEMNPEIIQILKEIFNHYSTEVNNQKRLFKEEACKIFQRATMSQSISLNDTRILHLFNNYSDSGQYLTVHEWINFYYQSALVNPYLVINNLKNLGYGEVFQSASQLIENFTIDTENVFRQYFATNQQAIYGKLFELFQIMRKTKLYINHHDSDAGDLNFQIAQKISNLILQILKELPKFQQLQTQVQKKFIDQFQDNSNVDYEAIEEEQQQVGQSIEKVYFTTIILGFHLDKLQEKLLSISKLSIIPQILHNAIVEEKQQENQTKVKQKKTKIQKIQSYCLNNLHELFDQLLGKDDQQIDPLNLSYEQNIIILTLQNIGSLVTRPLFKQINKVKNCIMKLQVSQLTPLSGINISFSIEEFIKIKKESLKSQSQLISNKLQKLSAINSDLLVNYSSVLLSELNNVIHEEIINDSRKIAIQSILSKFICLDSLLFTQQLQLSKISNHFVFLLSDSNIQGLTRWYIIQILLKYRKRFIQKKNISPTEDLIQKGMQCHQISTAQYFKTLNQLLLMQTNPNFLEQIKSILDEILQEWIKSYSYADFYEEKQRSQSIEGLLVCFKTLFEGVRFPNQSSDSHKLNKQKTSNLVQTLLTNFVLSQRCQQCLYQILSNVNRSDPSHNLTFAYKKFTELKLRKNSKLNTENQFQCGIYNLGCICYINSVFQQLYHIDRFTQAIIYTIPLEQKLQSAQKYFIEFQRVFYQLKYSKRAFIMTNKFCQNYQDYTGQSINIKEQHDADEFLNNFLDRIQKTFQNSYKVSKQHTIVRELFKGTMSNVITCQNCFTSKCNNEEFYVLSLQIKDQSTLSECLDKMIEPEVICDYYCNNCDKKVQSIHKYRKFDSLPNILFVHFQRLIFDLQTFTKIKLDHPVNFAEEIDLQNYFYTQLSQSCKYRLKGFVVHFGNSQGGHYISLIKNEQKNSWKKYDDSKITKWFWKTGIHEKDNAYLLIYEKVSSSNQQTRMEPESYGIKEKFMQEITQDNIELGKEITVIRPNFGKFLIQELQQSKITQNSSKKDNDDFQNDFLKSKLIWKYLKILDQAKNVGFSESLPLKDHELQYLAMQFISYNRFPQTAQHFLDIAVEQDLIKSLYQSGQKKIRQVFVAILINIVEIWNGFFSQSSYMIPTKQNQTIRKLMGYIQNSLMQVGKNYNKMDEYFQFLLILSKLVPKAREYLKEMNIVPKLIHFIMHKDSKLAQRFGVYPINAPTSKKVNCFNTIIEIVGLYLDQFPDIISNQVVAISLGEKGFEFYKKMYEERYENHLKLNSILARFCENNFQLTNRVIDQLILNKINRFNYDDFYIVAYLDLIYCLLSIKDQFKGHRTFRILGIPTLLIDTAGEHDIMVKKKRQRIVGYWNNFITSEDQMIIPFLEQLYNNRNSITYFEVIGIVYLLQLIKENNDLFIYVTKIPSPCLLYETYLSWMNEFLKTSLKFNGPFNNLQKINLKQNLNKISQLLEQIDCRSHFQKNPDKMDKNVMKDQIENNMIEQKSYVVVQQAKFVDPQAWINRNQRFLFGQIVEKSQTRLIKKLIYQAQKAEPTLMIPITYSILKTVHIENPLQMVNQILQIEDVIQPNQIYADQSAKKSKIDEKLKKYLSPQKVDSSLLKLSFSGQNEQLLPYRYKSYVLKIIFQHQYQSDIFISVEKLLNEECKIILPSPLSKLNPLVDHTSIDFQIENCMKLILLCLKNQKPKQNHLNDDKNADKMEQGIKNESNKQTSTKQDGVLRIEEEYPSMDQIYGSDAYMQQAQLVNQTQSCPKQEEVCIECPFCGYIAHEFASRCPGCNQEWGLYA